MKEVCGDWRETRRVTQKDGSRGTGLGRHSAQSLSYFYLLPPCIAVVSVVSGLDVLTVTEMGISLTAC